MKCRHILKWCTILLLTAVFAPLRAKSQTTKLADKKKINLLVVHSFEDALPDYPHLNELLAENLEKRKIAADMRVFYLDCDAYGHDDEIERMRSFLDTVYMRPDMILVTDDQATYSLLASRHPLVKSTPIVFSGVNFPNWNLLKEYTNVTGHWDNPDYLTNLRMIEELVGIKRIRFFYDKTYNGKQVIARLAEQNKDKDKELYESLTHFIREKDSIQNSITFNNRHLRGTDIGERPAKTELYFINMRDEVGSNLLWNITGSFRHSVFLLTKYDYTIAKVGRLATVPTFAAVNKGFALHSDILGGYFTTVEDQVKQTCDYIARIVQGEAISGLPVMETPKRYVVDWEVLNRWKISADEIPGYIEILNMPFYMKYKIAAIVFSVVFLACIALLIIYLLFLYRREARRKRQAQMNLWEEKEFLSLALEGGSIFAWKYDSREEKFTFDKEFTDSVLIAPEAIRLTDLAQMVHPDEASYLTATFLHVLKGHEDHGNLRAQFDFNGKGYIWYEFRFLNISGALGNRSSLIGLVMNIQEYKNKEEELTEARDMASKAELKQSFLANMSHEIRTPLNAIVGFSNMLVSTEELPKEEQAEYVQIINKNCDLLLKLINDILEISRIESGNMSFSFESCNLNDLVDDVYEMCSLQTPPEVEFIKKLPQEAICIETDVIRLKQVIINFINNAFKFTGSGHVRVGIDDNPAKKEVCIYVEDSGNGISAEQQKMIFDRFYKVDEFAQGTGLGLSICQVIAEKLNGRLSLISKVGKGSRFEIVLPYAGPPPSVQDEEVDPVGSKFEDTDIPDDNRPVVLIAEDSVSNYMVLKSILRKYCHTIWAVNGKDALKIVKKHKVDLVLMDIKMHEMDGLTALTKIRKSFKHLPVIIQTAYALDENQKLARQAGASGFIAKPISAEVLLQEIRRFIRIDE